MIDQIELAKQLLTNNEANSYRIALILIDNALEILMLRKIKSEYPYANIFESLINNARLMPNYPKEELADMERRVVCQDKRNKLERYYGEKIKYLNEKGIISKGLSSTLIYLHNYRNTVYHRDEIKHGTIKPAASIYFKLLCDLFVILKPSSIESSLKDDYKEFKEKYGLSQKSLNFFDDEINRTVAEILKKDAEINNEDLHENIVSHAKSRLDEIGEGLLFIKNNARFNGKDDLNAIYDYVQKIIEVNAKKQKRKAQKYSYKEIAGMLIMFEQMDGSSETEVINAFSKIEPTIEYVEKIVFEYAGELDQAIQNEIDIMRGK